MPRTKASERERKKRYRELHLEQARAIGRKAQAKYRLTAKGMLANARFDATRRSSLGS